MCGRVQGRGHHMTGKEDQSRRGARTEGRGARVSSLWQQHPPSPRPPQLPAVHTSKEGGRTSNPNRQRSSGSFLKGYTQRRRRAREGRAGRPRPSGAATRCPEPPAGPPRGPGPRAPGAGAGVTRDALLWNSAAAAAGPAPGGEKGVCARPVGGADQPAFLPPAPLRPDSGRRAASSLLTGRTPGGQRRRGVLGARGRTARASGSPWGWASGSELTVHGEPNSFPKGEGARTAPGQEPPRQKASPGRRAAAAAAPGSLAPPAPRPH